MPTKSPDIGHGTTIAFATQTWTAKIISIGGFTQERSSVPVPDLSTANIIPALFEKIRTAGSLDIEFYWDTAKIPAFADAEPVTITLPDTSTIIGQAAFTSLTTPTFETGGPAQIGTGTIEWNGKDSAGTAEGPVFAPATP